MEKSNGKISIIIPVYNGADFLPNCFHTLENQTIGMEQMECIFINDASTDGGATWDMLCGFEKRYPANVIVVNSEQNHRAGGSRNIGLEYASGDYIAFMDHDDTLYPTMLENMRGFLEKYQCDVVMCRFWKVKDENIYQPRRLGQDYILDFCDDEEREKLIAAGKLGYVVWDKLYRRELIQDNGIRFPDGRVYEDTYFCGMVGAYVKRLGVINETWYFYRQYETSTTESMTRAQRGDLLEVNNRKWEEYVRRGIYDCCKKGVECDYIQNYFLGGISNFSSVYEEMPYELFRRMCKDVAGRISKADYRENEYLQNGLGEWEKCLLELVWCDVDEEQWKSVVKLFGKVKG